MPTVSSKQNAAEVPAGMISGGGVVNDTMPTKPEFDAEAIQSSIKELEAQLAAKQKDIDTLRSVYDRKLDMTDKQLKAERREWEQKFRAAQMSSLTEEEKEKQEFKYLKTREQELEQQVADNQTRMEWFNYFVSALGLSPAEIKITGTVEELIGSGMEVVRNRLMQSSTPQQEEPKEPPKATPAKTKPPEVDTGAGTQTKPPTIKDLMDRYGKKNPEDIYRLFETGQLPKELFPS